MIKRSRIADSRGDTIVEVLIVLAILAFALTVAYSTAGRGLSQSRNAQEHSQALGIATSQIELLRAASAKQVDVFKSQPFCLNGPTPVTGFPATYTVPTSAKADTLDNSVYPASCQSGDYYTSVVYVPDTTNPSNSYFIVRVRWDGINAIGRQQESINYRLFQLTAAVPTQTEVTGAEPELKVVVNRVDPINGNTPSCSDTGYSAKSGVLVSLSGVPTSPKATDSSSSVLFNATNDGLVQGASYTASMLVPLGYTAPCPPSPVSATTKPTAGATVSFKIIPQCTTITKLYSNDPIYGSPPPIYNTYVTGGDPIYSPVMYYRSNTQAPAAIGASFDGGVNYRHLAWNKTTSPYSTQPSEFYVAPYFLTLFSTVYSAQGPYYQVWEAVPYVVIVGYTPIVVHNDIIGYGPAPIIGYTPVYHKYGDCTDSPEVDQGPA